MTSTYQARPSNPPTNKTNLPDVHSGTAGPHSEKHSCTTQQSTSRDHISGPSRRVQVQPKAITRRPSTTRESVDTRKVRPTIVPAGAQPGAAHLGPRTGQHSHSTNITYIPKFGDSCDYDWTPTIHSSQPRQVVQIPPPLFHRGRWIRAETNRIYNTVLN